VTYCSYYGTLQDPKATNTDKIHGENSEYNNTKEYTKKSKIKN